MMSSRRTALLAQVIGGLLSLLIVIAIFFKGQIGIGATILNLVILAAVISPFVVMAANLKRGMASKKVTCLTLPYLFCHTCLVQLYFRPGFSPQEFGFAPLVFLPLVESIVAVPVGFLLLLISQQFSRER